jgi:effector-binding domain-containing protein
MEREISVVDVEGTHIAVMRARVAMHEIPASLMPLVDQVWSFIRSGGAGRHGHNVWIYHHRSDGDVEVEVGVQVDSPFADSGEVASGETPAGRAAHAVYYGDYGNLSHVHRAVAAWCTRRGLTKTGDDWEIYGDWHEDPTQRRTDVYHLLANA